MRLSATTEGRTAEAEIGDEVLDAVGDDGDRARRCGGCGARIDARSEGQVEVVHVGVGEQHNVDGGQMLTGPGRRWRRSTTSRVAKTGSTRILRPPICRRKDEWPMKVTPSSGERPARPGGLPR